MWSTLERRAKRERYATLAEVDDSILHVGLGRLAVVLCLLTLLFQFATCPINYWPAACSVRQAVPNLLHRAIGKVLNEERRLNLLKYKKWVIQTKFGWPVIARAGFILVGAHVHVYGGGPGQAPNSSDKLIQKYVNERSRPRGGGCKSNFFPSIGSPPLSTTWQFLFTLLYAFSYTFFLFQFLGFYFLVGTPFWWGPLCTCSCCTCLNPAWCYTEPDLYWWGPMCTFMVEAIARPLIPVTNRCRST